MNLSATSFFKPLVVLSLGLSLFACGDKTAEQKPAQDEKAVTQEQPKAENTLTVATTQDFPPFTFLDDKGNVVGFDVDVINAVAKNKGLNVEFKATTFDRIFTEVENKTSDLGMSGIYHREDRASKYGLTKPYYFDKPVYYYRADNEKLAKATLNNLSDLNNHALTVAVVGSIDGLSSQHKIEAVKSEFAGFVGVIQGKYDVAFSDASVLNYVRKNNPDTAQVPVKTVSYEGDVGYTIVLNQENAELLKTLNEGIDELTQSGEIARLGEKWFK